MKTMNAIKRYGAQLTAAGGLMALPVMAFAAVPEEIKTSLAEAKTDALAVGGIVIGIIASIFALMLIRRVLR